MWMVSDRFLEALREPHEAVSTVDVLYNGILIEQGLPISAGSVTVDEGSQVRRSAQLTVADPTLDPESVIDLLAPFGTELLIQRGIRFGEGDVELAPLGLFRIESAGRSSWTDGVAIQAADRSKAVADARFIGPWSTPGGSQVRDEIARLITDALPDVEFYDLTDNDAPTSPGVWERDRWPAIESLAKSIGAEAVFDPLGRAVLRPVATNADEPVWTIDAGPRGVMLDVTTGLSREGVYNAVVATGERPNNEPPVTGYAFVQSGNLAWGGPFGKVPRFYTSQMISTLEQAQSAARAILARSSGFSRTIDPVSVVNPALDVGDAVEIVLPDGRRYRHIVRSLTIPLSEDGQMNVGTRVAEDTDIVTEGTLD